MAKKRKTTELLKKRKNEIGYALELKLTQEQLNREGYGNTFRRYLDDNLRKELGYLPKRQQHYIKRFGSTFGTNVKWDSTTQSFVTYYCKKHNFYPDTITIQNKCFQRDCIHLHIQRKKEIVVKTLIEALTIKQTIGRARIEQMKTGFKVTAL